MCYRRNLLIKSWMAADTCKENKLMNVLLKTIDYKMKVLSLQCQGWRNKVNPPQQTILVVATFLVKVSQKMEQKYSSRWTVEKVKEGKTYNYIPQLTERVIMLHETGETLLSENILSPDNPHNISPTIAPLPPPAAANVVTSFKSRFEE